MVTENGHQRLANHKIRPFKNTIWPLVTQDEPGPGFRPCRQQVDHNAKPNQDHAQSKNHDRYLEEHFNPFSYDFFPNFVRPSRRYYVVRGLRLLCSLWPCSLNIIILLSLRWSYIFFLHSNDI